MTTGIVEVACLSVYRFTPAATITSTRRRTSSAAWPAHSSGLPSPLGHEIPPIHVAELAHSAQERDGGRAPGLRPHHVGRRCGEAEDSDPIDLARRLGLGVSRPREGPEGGEAADERAPVHHWMIDGICGTDKVDSPMGILLRRARVVKENWRSDRRILRRATQAMDAQVCQFCANTMSFQMAPCARRAGISTQPSC